MADQESSARKCGIGNVIGGVRRRTAFEHGLSRGAERLAELRGTRDMTT